MNEEGSSFRKSCNRVEYIFAIRKEGNESDDGVLV